MTHLLNALNELAVTMHAGAIIAFALLVALRGLAPHVRDEHVIRSFRSYGAGIGLSLGAVMGTEIWRHVTTVNPGEALPGALGLDFSTAALACWSARALCLFAYWVSYIVLEVWTLEDCRRLDKDGVVADVAAYAEATSRVSRHLGINALLIAAVVIEGALARSLS